MRLTPRRLTVALVLTGCFVCVWLAAHPASARKPAALPGPQKIAITAKPVLFEQDKPRETRFGKLVWRGSLELTSDSPNFGGYSGLALSADGTRLVAVSDSGSWLTARLTYGEGRVTALTEAKLGPLLARNGEPLEGGNADAESLAFAQAGAIEGKAYVSFERNHRIIAYQVQDGAFGAPERSITLPPRAKDIGSNAGLEAITVLRAGPSRGAILAMSEEYLDDAGNHIGWLIGGAAPGQLSIRRLAGFAITDVTSLPGGDVVILERRFRFTEGVKMRLRRIKASDIRPGAVLEGDILFATDDLREIDNMEGLASHRDPDGTSVLTIISDDNFNPFFQRTLLMQFALPEN